MVDFKKDAKIQAAIPFALGVCALLAVIVLPNYLRQTIYTRSQGAHAVILMLVNALENYKKDVGAYPSTAQGLRALVGKPDGVSAWDGPYLHKDVPLDPWNRSYIYKFPGKTPGKPEIVSYGADGVPGGEGENADIVSE